jgi:hypothetical protein
MSYQFSTTTSLSDETYLESFIESISSTLPGELRRNLEHLRCLDDASVGLMERWRDMQDDCARGVEVALLGAFRRGGGDDGGGGDAAVGGEEEDDDDDDDARRGGGETTDGGIIGESPPPSSPSPPPPKRKRGRPPKRRLAEEDGTSSLDQNGPEKKIARIDVGEGDGDGDGDGDGGDPTTRKGEDADVTSEADGAASRGGGDGDATDVAVGESSSSPPSPPGPTTGDGDPPAVLPRRRGRPPKWKYQRRRTTDGGGGASPNEDGDRDGAPTSSYTSPREVGPPLSPSPSPSDRPPTRGMIECALRAGYPDLPSVRREIDGAHLELRRYADEKAKTARQLRSLIDMALGRLDRDLERFERELGIDPPVVSNVAVGGGGGGGGAGPNDSRGGGGGATVVGVGGIVAGGGGVGSTDVGHRASAHAVGGRAAGGAHGGSQNPASLSSSAAPTPMTMVSSASNAGVSGLRRSSSSVVSASASASAAALLPPPNNASTTSSALRQQQQQQQQPHHHPTFTNRGVVPPPPKAVRTDNLAAIQVSPDPTSDWILAKVLSHDKPTRMYTLKDEDLQSNQIYRIPESRVVPLRGTERNRWARGDAVYAVYPDTTSFYRAVVSTPPFNGFVMVQFANDEDADGVTHEKAVLMAHVMRVPPGAK